MGVGDDFPRVKLHFFNCPDIIVVYNHAGLRKSRDSNQRLFRLIGRVVEYSQGGEVISSIGEHIR